MDMVVPVSVSFYVVLFLISLAQFQVQSFQVHQVPTSPEHKEVFDKCDAFLKPVIERRNACLKEAKDIVDICVNYSTDVEYIIPFILHHLALGVRTVRLYNNDHRYSWYYHPTIVCLIRSELLILQSWPGDGTGIQGYNHCKTRIDRNLNTSGLWQANLDMDELIILKKTKCLNTFLSQYKTPAVHIRWAMFVPQLPLQDYHFTSIAPDNSLIIPHEMLNTRKKSSLSFKTISRTECVLSYPNPHTIRVKDNCKYGGEKNLIWVDEKYSNSQINHYWGLSMKHFLRKMHRGAGSERSRADPQHYRDTTILFSYSRDVIVDNSFEELYGGLWKELKSICLNCFNLTYFYDYKV